MLDIVPGENINTFVNNIKEFEKVRVCHESPNVEDFPNFPMKIKA